MLRLLVDWNLTRLKRVWTWLKLIKTKWQLHTKTRLKLKLNRPPKTTLLLYHCNCKYHVEQSCSSLVYGSFWCSSSSGYSHIMLKSVNIPSCIISSVCVTAQIFSRLTVWTMSCIFFQTLKGRCPSIVAHESKLQKASVDPAVRSGLWKNIQDQNCSDLPSEAERPETPADHSPFHRDWKLLQNKHTIYHQELNQSSINQSMDDLKSDL